MKIICIGKNYADHAKEMNSPVPLKPLIFMKPDSALLQKNKAFYLPDFSDEIHYETELVLKINKVGKHIDEKFAGRYFNEITLGFDFTARDLQRECKKKGHPWEIAKGFDASAAVGKFISKDEFDDMNNLKFRLEKDGKTAQAGNSSDLIFGFNYLISYISRFFTLKIGDLIYTGTPAGVGKLEIGNRLEAYLEERKLLDVQIK